MLKERLSRWNSFYFIKFLKNNQKELALPSFYYPCKGIWLGSSWKHICIHQSRSWHFWHSYSSNFFSISSNIQSTSWITHITRDFFARSSCLRSSFMLLFRLSLIEKQNMSNECYVTVYPFFSWRQVIKVTKPGP